MFFKKDAQPAKTTQVNIGGARVGIVGLDEAVEAVARTKPRTGTEIGARLVEILKEHNYIPAGAEEEYRRDLTRYYRMKMGLPVDEPAVAPGTVEVKVFGPGCARCKQMYEQVLDIVAAEGIVANVEYVNDMAEMAAHGVLITPALMINGTVKVAGKMPSRGELVAWLKEADTPPPK